MSLILYYHPLASFCWKVLIALYENDTSFEAKLVDLADEASRTAFQRIWPIGKFPVLVDTTRDRTVPESSIIIEYLTQHYPGTIALIPSDPDLARETRSRDRFFDLQVHEPMQKVVTDKIRPPGKSDPYGVDQAKHLIDLAYGMINSEMATKTWAMGESFTMADCAAAPALYYANRVRPLGDQYPHVKEYLDRLTTRPSFARVFEEAQPYFAQFPG